MRVDIVDLGRMDLGIAQSLGHSSARAGAVRGGGGDMMCIARHAEAGDGGVRFAAALPHAALLLEQHDGGALGDDEAVAAGVEGAAGTRVGGVGQGAGAREAGDDEVVQRGLSRADEHGVRVAAQDGVVAVAHGVQAGRAGRRGREARAAERVRERDQAGRGVGQQARDEERGDAARGRRRRRDDGREMRERGADGDARAGRRRRRGVGEGVRRGVQREETGRRRGWKGGPRRGRRRHERRQLRRVRGRVRLYARVVGRETRPGRGRGGGERSDDADAGHEHAAGGHGAASRGI